MRGLDGLLTRKTRILRITRKSTTLSLYSPFRVIRVMKTPKTEAQPNFTCLHDPCPPLPIIIFLISQSYQQIAGYTFEESFMFVAEMGSPLPCPARTKGRGTGWVDGRLEGVKH